MYKTDFPFFSHRPDILYLDSAATTQKPREVIERVAQYYVQECAPVGRSLYEAGVAATSAIATIRQLAWHFFDAPEESEVIFTSGATESLNLLAHGIAHTLQEGDEIILSESEHHANIVPWQEMVKTCGARILFIRNLENGQIDLEQLGESLSERTRVVSLSLVSNVFGTLLPVGEIQNLLGKQGRRPWFFLDASQAAAHLPLSLRTLGCDALVLSAHKMYGPSGVGLLWGRTPLLEQLAPYRTGGGMISKVSLPETSYAALPERLEAGSPNTEGILGFGAALSYLERIGMEAVRTHTEEVSTVLRAALEKVPGVSILGDPHPSSGIISISHEKVHPHDLAQFLADKHICVRAGHQCAQPLHAARNLPGSLRVSVGLYNSTEDAARLEEALREALVPFGYA
ncbi:MAG TPA: cysteine desulfurase [Verrucomicrobiae bacterium]|nr:cysteine desulfurase [Verrucomicrobiae bacterium]